MCKILKNINVQQRMATGGANGKIKKSVMPGHVRASINWNTMRDAYKDLYLHYGWTKSYCL